MSEYIQRVKSRRTNPLSATIGTTMSNVPYFPASESDIASISPDQTSFRQAREDRAKMIIDAAISAYDVDKNNHIGTAMEKPNPRLMPLKRGGYADLTPMTQDEERKFRAESEGKSMGPVETGLLSAADAATMGMAGKDSETLGTTLAVAGKRNPLSSAAGSFVGASLPVGVAGMASRVGLGSALERITARLAKYGMAGRVGGRIASGAALESVTGGIYGTLKSFAGGQPTSTELLHNALEEALLFARFGSAFGVFGAAKGEISRLKEVVRQESFRTWLNDQKASMAPDEFAKIEQLAKDLVNPKTVDAIRAMAKVPEKSSPPLLEYQPPEGYTQGDNFTMRDKTPTDKVAPRLVKNTNVGRTYVATPEGDFSVRVFDKSTGKPTKMSALLRPISGATEGKEVVNPAPESTLSRPADVATGSESQIKSSSAPAGEEGITDKQRKMIFGVAKSKGLAKQDITDALQSQFGIDSLSKLKKSQVDALLKSLKPKTGGEGSTELGAFGFTPSTVKGLGESAGKMIDKAKEVGTRASRKLSSLEGRMQSPQGKQAMTELQNDVDRLKGNLEGRFMRFVSRDIEKLSKADSQEMATALLENKRPDNAAKAKVFDDVKKVFDSVGRLKRKVSGPTPQRDLFNKSDSPFNMKKDYGGPHWLTQEAREALTNDVNVVLKEVAPDLAPYNLKDSGSLEAPLGQQARHSKAIQDVVQKWLDANEGRLSDAMKSAIDHNRTHGVSSAETVLHIRQDMGWEQPLYRSFGPLHYSRKIDYPTALLEKDIREVLPRYIAGAARDIALTKKYGHDMSGFKDLVTEIAKVDPEDAKNMITTMRAYTGAWDIPKAWSESKILRPIVEELSAAQYFKLSPRSSVVQFTQPSISFLPDHGYYRFVKAGTKRIAGGASGSASHRRIFNSGVMDVDAIHAFGGDVLGWKSVSKSVPIYLKGIMFRQANRTIAYMAGLQGEQAIKDLASISKGKGLAAERAQVLLKDQFGIDYTKKITEHDFEQGIYKYVTNSQLFKDITKETALMSHPVGRRLFTLMKFPLKQSKMVKDMVVSHARATRKIGGLGAILPIMRLAAGGFISGEAYIYVVNKINSYLTDDKRFRADKSLGEIWDDPSVRDIMIHALNNYVAVGSLGLFSDVLRVEPTQKRLLLDLKRNIGGLFVIPAIDQIKDAGEKTFKLAQDLLTAQGEDKMTAAEFAKRVGKDTYELLFPGPASMTPGLVTEDEKAKNFANRLKPLKHLEYDEQVWDRIIDRLQDVKRGEGAKLISDEKDRIHGKVMDLFEQRKVKEAKVLQADFNRKFSRYLTSDTKLNIGFKEVMDYLKRKRKAAIPSKEEQEIARRLTGSK